MIQEICAGLYTIGVPLPNSPLKVLNAYLIRGKERHLLIDNGFNTPECLEALLAGLRKLDADPGKTDYCITHRHLDHCGLTPTLAGLTSRNSQPKIISGQEEAEAIEAYGDSEFWAMIPQRMAVHGFPLAISRRMFGVGPVSPYKEEYPFPFTIVEDGDTLDYGDFSLRVVKVPGHTPGQITLYESQHKLYFAADHILGSISPNIASWHDGKDSLGLYLHNLEKIKGYDISLSLTGHRALVENTVERIEQLQRHHQTRLAEALTILADGAADAWQVASRMQWSIRARQWDDFPIPQKWFATGEALAHLEHLESLGEVRRANTGGHIFFERLA